MHWPLSSGSELWISRKVLQHIHASAIASHPNEAGGVLIGWSAGKQKVITGMIDGGPASSSSPSSFLPEHEWQVRLLREIFRHTSGDLDYLGDWHSHPCSSPNLSSVDKETLKRIATQVPDASMVILGRVGEEWNLRSWGASSSWIAPFRQEPVRFFDAPPHWPSAFLVERPLPFLQ